MFKTKRLGPVINNKLPGIKLCKQCQARFKKHMDSYLPVVSGDNPVHIPDFVLCNDCWYMLLNEAGINDADKAQIQQGADLVQQHCC